jgi:colanic acid/amylovoran biosynthesis protein
MRKTFVFITAYIANNLGDDMFISLLCSHYPHVNFIIQCPELFSSAFENLRNITVISDSSKLNKNDIDFQIFIGGSLFMEPQDISKIENKFESVISCRLSNDIPFFVIGANFGPYTQKLHFDLYKQWFQQLDGVCFRDKQSFELFKTLTNVMWAPDLIFNYQLSHYKHNKSNITIVPIYNTKRIGLPNFSNELYFLFLSNVAFEYIKIGYTITLASFCEAQLDNIACYKIYNSIPLSHRKNVNIISYKNNIDSFLEKFLNTDYIIGTRFHSIILALKAKIPVFPIIYNQKISNIIKDYNFEGNFAHIMELNELKFDYIDRNRQKLYIPDFSLYERLSSLHFHYFNEALIKKEFSDGE